jgi:hypothetical protein
MLYPLSYEGARHQGTFLRCPAVAWAYRPSPPVVVRHTADRGAHGDPTSRPMILERAPMSACCHPRPSLPICRHPLPTPRRHHAMITLHLYPSIPRSTLDDRALNERATNVVDATLRVSRRLTATNR